MEQKFEYYAFISYKREDEKWAKWLQDRLRWYKLPSKLCRTITRLPKKVWPVFRDNTDLNIGPLAENIQKELDKSHFLIVISSPESAKSAWVGKEIEYFAKLGRTDNIIPFVISGEPYSHNLEKECIHPVIKSIYKKELFVININEKGKDSFKIKKRRAFIRVVARLLDIQFNSLWNPYERILKIRKWSIGIATIFLLAIVLSIWDYNRIKYEYYADYIERWGVPEGVIKLNEKEIKSRYSHYKFEYKRGKVQSITYQNSHKQLAFDVNFTEEFVNIISDKKYKMLFHYEDDKIISRDIYNGENQLDIIEKFSGERKEIVDLQDSAFSNKGIKMETSLLSSIFSLFIPKAYAGYAIFTARKLMLRNSLSHYYTDSGISRLIHERNEKGEILKTSYKKDAWNENKSLPDGATGKVTNYDQTSRIISIEYIYNNDTLCRKYQLQYDTSGNIHKIVYNSSSKEYLWKYINRFSDNMGNIIEERFYDSQNSLITIKKNKYKKGLLQSSLFTDKQGKIDNLGLIESTNTNVKQKNYAKIEYTYDENGLLINDKRYHYDGRTFTIIESEEIPLIRKQKNIRKRIIEKELKKLEEIEDKNIERSAPKFAKL